MNVKVGEPEQKRKGRQQKTGSTEKTGEDEIITGRNAEERLDLAEIKPGKGKATNDRTNAEEGDDKASKTTHKWVEIWHR